MTAVPIKTGARYRAQTVANSHMYEHVKLLPMAAGCDQRRLDNFVTKERSIQMSRQTLHMILGASDWFRSGEQNHAMAR